MSSAIGTTFDTDTVGPLFGKASFILPPPVVEETPDLSWYFLKVRFRPTMYCNECPDKVPRAADWTYHDELVQQRASEHPRTDSTCQRGPSSVLCLVPKKIERF